MDDTVPPRTSPADLPPVRTQDDLHRLWSMLMGPLGLGGRSLWLLLLEKDGQPTPVLVQVDALLPVPDLAMHENLERFVRHLIDDAEGSSVAFLLTRPGRAGITAGERRWAELLGEVVRRIGTRSWPVHRANDDELVVVAPDDLAATASPGLTA